MGWREDKEKQREYFRKYYQKHKDAIKKKTRKWYWTHREEAAEYNAWYAQTDAGKLKRALQLVRCRRKYPERNAARKKLKRAVDSGKILRLPCQVCGDPKSQGHHEDYLKPLEVIWLCDTHHKERHNKPMLSPESVQT